MTNPLAIFEAEAPQVAAAFTGLIDAIVASDGLDARTKQLAYIAMKAALGDRTAVTFHVPMARALGASRAEVRDAVLLSLTTSGIAGVAACLPAALEAYDALDGNP